MCVRGKSRVCKMNGRAFEMLGGDGREVRPIWNIPLLYKNEQKRKGKHLMETTCNLSISEVMRSLQISLV